MAGVSKCVITSNLDITVHVDCITSYNQITTTAKVTTFFLILLGTSDTDNIHFCSSLQVEQDTWVLSVDIGRRGATFFICFFKLIVLLFIFYFYV